MYENEEAANAPAMLIINVEDARVYQEVDVSRAKYGIRLWVPSAEGMTEYSLRYVVILAPLGMPELSSPSSSFRFTGSGREFCDSSAGSTANNCIATGWLASGRS